MKKENFSGFRVLARDIAQELTLEEVDQVSGGLECTTTVKATWSAAKGNDGEVSVSCR